MDVEPWFRKLAAEIRRREDRPDMPFYLIGHSGGGQFLIRLAAFITAGADRIVVANPGTYIFPTRDQEFPLGFGGLPPDLSSDEALRHFLAQPITLYLGKEDLERDEYLAKTPAADRQGQLVGSADRTPFAPPNNSPAIAAGRSTGGW